MICVSREDIEQNTNYYVQKIYDELDKAVFITLQMLKWDNENDRSTIYYFQKCEIDEETGKFILPDIHGDIILTMSNKNI